MLISAAVAAAIAAMIAVYPYIIEADVKMTDNPRHPVHSKNLQKATFAAGCFWHVQHSFQHLLGVIDTIVGYTGGHLDNPTYEDICYSNTGHAEAVQITYDTNVISYEKLLDTFWKIHDPTTPNRQGPDIGSQYRSAIFFHDQKQLAAAKHSRNELQHSGKFENSIVTEIKPAKKFYKAENYHQNYFHKNRRTTCLLK